MASPDVEGQLVNGWFEAEESNRRHYRWGSGRAALIMALADPVSRARISYRLPPVDSGVELTISSLDQGRKIWSTTLAWRDAEWHEDSFPLELIPGRYVALFEAATPWSNPGQVDGSLWPESRSLGFALSSLWFDA